MDSGILVGFEAGGRRPFESGVSRPGSYSNNLDGEHQGVPETFGCNGANDRPIPKVSFQKPNWLIWTILDPQLTSLLLFPAA